MTLAVSQPPLPIYFDHNASSPPSSTTCAITSAALQTLFANPSSPHSLGQTASFVIAQARSQIAKLLGVPAHTLVLTSSATEASNLAIFSLAKSALQSGRSHVLVSPLEHPCVLGPLRLLQSLKAIELEWLPVLKHGHLDLEAVKHMLRPNQTGLVCCMAAHNELGTLYPVHDVAALAHAVGAVVHCDASQAAGKVPLSLQNMPADTVVLSGHKLGGPKGVGALYVAPGLVPLTPMILGGGQEQGLRSGTENTAAIVGFGAAVEERLAGLDFFRQHTAALRDLLWDRLQVEVGHVVRHTPHDETRCLPNTLHVSFLGTDGLVLTKLLSRQGIMVSTGSACVYAGASGGFEGHTPKSQHISALKSVGLTGEEIAGAIRFSFGPCNTVQEVLYFIKVLSEVLPLAQDG